MSRFSHNLSMQTLSISDDSIVLKFDASIGLNKNISDLIDTNNHMLKKEAVIIKIQNLDPPTIIGDEPTINNIIESTIVKQILNDEKPPTDVDNDDNNNDVSDIPLAKVAEKIEPEIDCFGEDLQKLFQANIRSDYELAFNNVIGINDWANKIKVDQEMREPKLDTEAQQFFNAEVDAVIQERNANILPQMLASNKTIESTISEKIKELQDEQNKQSAAKIEPKLDAYLSDENHKISTSITKQKILYNVKLKLHKSKRTTSRKNTV